MKFMVTRSRMRRDGASAKKKSRLDKVQAELKQARDEVEAERKKILKEIKAEASFQKTIEPKVKKAIKGQHLELKYPYSSQDDKTLGWAKGWSKTLNEAQDYPFAEVVKNGKVVGYVKRLKYGEYDGDDTDFRCHDCGANIGEFHSSGCDWERDPVEGGQMLSSEAIGNIVSSVPVDAKKFKQYR